MKCKRVQEMMGTYLYGDLAPDQMREIRLHTQACAACREDVESRGKVLSAIPGAAPELSDDERTQIAWAVKGAIRNGVHSRESFGLRRGYAAAAATLVLAGLGVAAIMFYNSSKPLPSDQARQKPPSSAVVSIQEERTSPARKPEAKPQLEVRKPAAPSGDKKRPVSADRTPDIRRRLATFGITAREDAHERKIAVDKPAAVISEPRLDEPPPAREGEKLPKPTDPNDAQTAPQ